MKVMRIKVLVGLTLTLGSFVGYSQTLYVPQGAGGIGTSVNAGKIGIGTNAPINHLQIEGTDAELNLLVQNNNTPVTRTYLTAFAGKSSIQTDRDFTVRTNFGGPWTDKFIVTHGGNVGIGTSGLPSQKLHLFGGSSTFINIDKAGDANEGGVLFSRAGTTLFYLYNDNVTNALKIQASGLSGELDETPRMQFPLANKNIYMAESGGNVGIGTTNPGGYKLAVEGKIGAREVVVTTAAWADYVFEPTYNLRPLSEVETYVKENKHLPEIPSAKEVEASGVSLGEMNMLLLKKVEELTLYVIELKKEIEKQKEKIESLEAKQSKNEK